MIVKILRALKNKETFAVTHISGKYKFIAKDESIEIKEKDVSLFNKALMVVTNQLQFEIEDELSKGPFYD